MRNDRIVRRNIDPDRESHDRKIYLMRCELGSEFPTTDPMFGHYRCNCEPEGYEDYGRHAMGFATEDGEIVMLGTVDADKTKKND